MNSLINRINQGKYDTENELKNLRNNAIRLGKKSILRAVNKRLKKRFPKVYQCTVVGNHKKKSTKKQSKTLKNMTSSERIRYINKLCGPDKEYSNDIFDRGLVVSGGAFGMA